METSFGRRGFKPPTLRSLGFGHVEEIAREGFTQVTLEACDSLHLTGSMVILPLIGNPYDEYINPWVDDPSPLTGNNKREFRPPDESVGLQVTSNSADSRPPIFSKWLMTWERLQVFLHVNHLHDGMGNMIWLLQQILSPNPKIAPKKSRFLFKDDLVEVLGAGVP